MPCNGKEITKIGTNDGNGDSLATTLQRAHAFHGAALFLLLLVSPIALKTSHRHTRSVDL